MTHNPGLHAPCAVCKACQEEAVDDGRDPCFITACSRYDTLYDALWLVMLGSGCRIGEALAIREMAVDWQSGTITVDEGIVRVGTIRQVSDPKTEAGTRKISLPKFALDALKHRKGYLVDGYFFRTAVGTIPWTSDLQRRLKEACFRCRTADHKPRPEEGERLPGHRRGVDVKTVQKRLGHATLAMTLGLYAEAMEMGDTKASEVLDRLLAPNPSPELPGQSETPPATDGTPSEAGRLWAECPTAGPPRAATLAFHADGDPYAVQHRLGHSHISGTLGIYVYGTRSDEQVAGGLTPSSAQNGADRIGDASEPSAS